MVAKESKTKSAEHWEQEILVQLDALGNSNTAQIRALRRGFSKQLAHEPARVVIEIALRLVERSEVVHRFIACELVQHHRAAFQKLDARLLSKLSRDMNNWASVDIFSCYLLGPAWREGLITDDVIRNWTLSKDRWVRRAALVATVPLNNKTRGGSGDSRRTLAICEMLIEDRDDMVTKAMSWALRELSKRDATVVKTFMVKYAENLAPRVVREVNNKLRTGLKTPKRSD